MHYTVALTGNPNSGKTTLFNELTGASQHVGNWPGVTVEKKEGKMRADKEAIVVDLPGIYSLSPYTLEEVIARDYLINEHPDVIINIVDASNLERNLYLTTQVLEMGIPTVIALNMMDLVRRNGDKIDTGKLSRALGAPIVEISALHGENMDGLVKAAREAAEDRKAPSPEKNFSEDIECLLEKIEAEGFDASIHEEKRAAYAKIAPRWIAVKLFEQDEKVLEDISLSESLQQEIAALEDAHDDDAQTLISEQRYDRIAKIISTSLERKNAGKLSLTDRIDKIVTNRVLALPIFAAVIFLIYYVSVTTLGGLVTDFTNDVFVAEWIQEPVRAFMENASMAPWLVGMICDGVIAGVGAVLGFLPQMAILFIFLSFLEQCGYMSRIAFILDRIFRRFGLSGKSFIPMLIATGCGIPGVMASRTIENEADRKMTAMTATFMPCGAKLPIIAFFAGTVFGGTWWVAPSFYFVGITAVIVSGIILKKTKRFAGDPAPFVMELPEYRLPTLKGMALTVWERLAAFAKKAGTIILASAIVLWFLQAFGFTEGGFGMVEDSEQSLLAGVGNAVCFLFAPLGFGDWKSTVATVTGLIAKENVITTFGVLFGVAGDALELVEEGDWGVLTTISAHYTVISAYSLLLFNLLCAPCFAAIGAMNKELGGGRWTLFGIGYQTILAYSTAFVFYQLATFFTGGVFTLWTGLAIVVLAIWLYLLFRPAPKIGQEVADREYA
uniref:ferrous iron transport protein B n=1 Tax=Ndongobacter massiliensis TaxID=1871025 RepID=UPI000931FFAF|nr:ferrous iron transport protein B [Ndongobacter massiliensis]